MGEPMRAYEAGQELLCRPPSNSNASGTHAARLVRSALSVHAGFADARLHYLAPCYGGLAACALSPANLGSADVYA